MCVQNQWAFLKVEILNGFKWSISRRVNDDKTKYSETFSGLSLYRMVITKLDHKRKFLKIHLHVHVYIALGLFVILGFTGSNL